MRKLLLPITLIALLPSALTANPPVTVQSAPQVTVEKQIIPGQTIVTPPRTIVIPGTTIRTPNTVILRKTVTFQQVPMVVPFAAVRVARYPLTVAVASPYTPVVGRVAFRRGYGGYGAVPVRAFAPVRQTLRFLVGAPPLVRYR